MIFFKTVRFKNFFATGNSWTEVKLDQVRRTLALGPNGAGKSNFIESLAFALYGKTIRNVNKNQIVNTITGKDTLVELEFSIGNKEYLVRRGLKPNIFEIFVDGKLLNQDSHTRDYQEMLETQILRMNYKSFTQIATLAVGSYTPFMLLPAAGRREVIEDLLDIQIFSSMNVLLKSKIQDNKDALSELDLEIKLAEGKLDVIKKHIEEAKKSKRESIANRIEQIEIYRADNDLLAKNIADDNDLRIALTSKAAEAKGLKIELVKTEGLLRNVNIRVRGIAKDIEFFEHSASCPTCHQTIHEDFRVSEIASKKELLSEGEAAGNKLKEKIASLTEQLKEFENVADSIKVLDRKLSESNATFSSNQRFISTIEAEIEAAKSKVSNPQAIEEKEELEEKLRVMTKEKESLVKHREVLSLASQMLKDGGIKAHIIRQYIPVINKLLAKYLASLDFFVQFELDDQFRETIRSRYRDELSFQSFSKGEQLRLDLAILFTFRAIAKLRNSNSTNILFFDEILDSSLDMSGIDDFLNLVDKTEDCNIFIISHRGDRMVDKFDSVIEVEKVRNFSRMKYVR